MSGPQPNTHTSLEAGECERPMSTSVWFQQSHMVFNPCRGQRTPLLIGYARRYNLILLQVLRVAEVTTDCLIWLWECQISLMISCLFCRIWSAPRSSVYTHTKVNSCSACGRIHSVFIDWRTVVTVGHVLLNVDKEPNGILCIMWNFTVKCVNQYRYWRSWSILANILLQANTYKW